MFSFLYTQHPLIAHIHSLIDRHGIDQYGKIRWTPYSFDIDIEYPLCKLYDDTHSIIKWQRNYDIQYRGTKSLFKRADKLMKKEKQRIADEAIQQRITTDIEKYLTSDTISPIPEAMEDLKQINYHKNEIIKLSKKWQDQVVGIHTS